MVALTFAGSRLVIFLWCAQKKNGEYGDKALNTIFDYTEILYSETELLFVISL